MDPNTALAEAREAWAAVLRALDSDDRSLGERVAALETAASDLADRAEALDGWLSGGGFLPDAWKVGRE